jgi:hypothetical protein
MAYFCPIRVSLLDGDRGRDRLGRIGYGGCGDDHAAARRNRGRGLVGGRNIAGDGVRTKRATLSYGHAGEIYPGIFGVVGDDCGDTLRLAGTERGRRRESGTPGHYNRAVLILGTAAGEQREEWDCDERDFGERDSGDPGEKRSAKSHCVCIVDAM